jgi:outer membrane murein-binding lipoprotein Lpp
VDPGGEPVQTVAVAPADDQHALRARPVRPVLAAAILALLLAGGCARPAERDQTATATTAPSTTTPPTTAQDTEALRRARLEVERFCMTRFPDHCAGVALVTGQAATAIKVEPVGKQPTPQELAAFRKQLEQFTGEKMTDEEFASFMKLFEQLPQPSPEQVAELLAAGAGVPGFDLSGRNRLVVYRRPWTPRSGSGTARP